MTDDLDDLLAEQIAYYEARAEEYDATAYPEDDPEVRALREMLAQAAPLGQALELACGTGVWTGQLGRWAERVVAVDASAAMLALNHERLGASNVEYVQADLFSWSPPAHYDFVFFCAWLSHVPPARFDAFWSLVARCLAPDGRVFCVDERPAVAALERFVDDAPAPAVERVLTTGERHRAVKVFYEPDELCARLATIGWEMDGGPVGPRLFQAQGGPAFL